MSSIQPWTGREAHALRLAYRLSVRNFAAFLGIGARTVAAWSSDPTITPRPDTQAILDTALRRASDEVTVRFQALVTKQDHEGDEQPEPLVDVSFFSRPPAVNGAHQADEPVLPLLRQLGLSNAPGWSGCALPRQREAAYEQLVRFLIAWAENVNRREVLRLLGWAASAAAAAPALEELDSDQRQRLVLAIQTPSRVDGSIVDSIEDVLYRCMRQDDVLGPQAALDTVLAQRSLARAMLRECPGDLRPRMLSVYSNLSAYAGWLAFDLNDFDSASYYYEEARANAHEAHDSELGALILCNMSHLATWRSQARIGIDHAVAAQVWAKKSGNVTLQAYAADRAARAYAMDEQHTACLQELDTAQELLAEMEASSANTLMYFYSNGLLANTRSICLLARRNTQAAIGQAQAALALIDESFVRNRAFGNLYLGSAYTSAKEIDEAATVIGAAAEMAVRNRSARLAEALRSARTGLQPWADSQAVIALDDRLASHGFTFH